MLEVAPTASATPIVAWFGPQPPVDLRKAIQALATLSMGPDARADLWVVWSEPQPRALAMVRRARVPTIVVSTQAPARSARQKWLDAGAGDAVSLSALPITLARRLRSIPRAEEAPAPRASQSGEPQSSLPPTDAPAPPRRLGVSSPPFAPEPLFQSNRSSLPGRTDDLDPEAAEKLKRSLIPEAPPTPPTTRALPAMAVQTEASWPPPGLDDWVRGLERYIEARTRWLTRARAKLKLYLELCHLREQMPLGTTPRLPIDVFGQTKGQDVQPLSWPVMVRRTAHDGESLRVDEGKLQHVGTDGLVVEVIFRAEPRQRMLLDLSIDSQTNAQLMVESQWQRRLGIKRWQIGALILQMRRVELDVDTPHPQP